LLLEVLAVVDPALGRAGRHRDADEGALRGPVVRLLPVDGLLARPARGHAEREPKAQCQADELPALHVFTSGGGCRWSGPGCYRSHSQVDRGPRGSRHTRDPVRPRLLALSLRASTPECTALAKGGADTRTASR